MNFKLIAEGLDVAPLLALLEKHEWLWYERTIRQDFPGSPHHDTEAIYFREPLAFTPEEYQGTTTSQATPGIPQEVREALVDLLYPVLKSLGWLDMGYVMAVKLLPGGHVDEHIDEGVYADHYNRFHLVLKTNGGATLTVGGEERHLKAGEFWWFNHKQPHSADNLGSDDRIHIIFDAEIPALGAPVYPIKD